MAFTYTVNIVLDKLIMRQSKAKAKKKIKDKDDLHCKRKLNHSHYSQVGKNCANKIRSNKTFPARVKWK